MYIDIYFSSTKRHYIGKWIRIPTSYKEIDNIIKEICTDFDDNCAVTMFKTKLNLNSLDILGITDIYYLNDVITNLNAYAADKELIALSETYSNRLEEILSKVYRKNYKFYPNKSLEDVAQIFSKRKYYRYYNNEQIIDDLSRRGFEETSTGVIYNWGY